MLRDDDAAGAGDAPLKPLRTILEQEIQQAEEELERPAHGILVSGVLAGLAVGVSTFAMAALLTLTRGELPASIVTLLAANAYTVGFVIVVLAHTDLFTEYTTIAILPVLTGRAKTSTLLRLWALVYAGNMIGAFAFALLLAFLGPALHVVDAASLEVMALRLVNHPWWVILLSALLAGLLMGFLSWLVAAGKDTISQIVCVWMITGLIGLAHLHHAITGALDVLAALVLGVDLSVPGALRMLLVTTIGNAIGGLAFAALIRIGFVVERPAAEGAGRRRPGDRRLGRHS
jgi:formate-nitrite transporter family protein